MDHTQIAGRDVQIETGPKTVVHFSDGCNPADPPGNYEFWTMKNESAALVVGRRPEGRDPGERFRMMQHQPGYEAAWANAQTATLLRPTSRRELLEWLNNVAHAADAPCAGLAEVGGTKWRVVKGANGRYDLEPIANDGAP